MLHVFAGHDEVSAEAQRHRGAPRSRLSIFQSGSYVPSFAEAIDLKASDPQRMARATIAKILLVCSFQRTVIDSRKLSEAQQAS